MKIGMLSDSVLTPTGYANVTLELLTRLSKRGHECYMMAHNYHGQTLKSVTFEDGKQTNFTIIGAGNMPYFKDRLADMINKYKFDVFICLLDTFMVKEQPYNKSWFESFDFTPCKTIFYFPSDGRKFPLGCETILRKVDLPIAMAKFGQEQVKKDHNIESKYIPHGIDMKNYYPDDKDKAKEIFGLKGKFVVGVVARNQGRKMLDRTIKAFAEFSNNKDDAMLLLHLDPYDMASVFDMGALIREYKIENKVRFTGMRAFSGFTLEQMRSVYNAMDLFLLTTSGEGFGIPTIEAMACEVPVMLTDYTTSAELTDNGECGYLVPVDTEILGTWNVERAIMSIPDCVKMMNDVYADRKSLIEIGKKGREKVIKEYSWDLLEEIWEKTLTELIE